MLGNPSDERYDPSAVSESALEAGVISVLTPLLGIHTSRRAFALACKQVGIIRARATEDDLEPICQRLSPMLRTLLGVESSVRVLQAIRRHVREGGAR